MLGLWCVVSTLMIFMQLGLVYSQPQNGPGYLGCFRDCQNLIGCGNRALQPIGPIESDDQSVEWCFRYCLAAKSSNYKYAGLEYGVECFCGNNDDYGRLGKRTDSECQDECDGNSNQKCGDFEMVSVYRISEGVCSNDIGPPTNGSHRITNPRSLSDNLDNFKFFGTRVDFYCHDGYTLHGASSIKCIDTGYNNVTWNDTVPTCVAWSQSTELMTSLVATSTVADGISTNGAVYTMRNDPVQIAKIVGPLGALLALGAVSVGLLIAWKAYQRKRAGNSSQQYVTGCFITPITNAQSNEDSNRSRHLPEDTDATAPDKGTEGVLLSVTTALGKNDVMQQSSDGPNASYGNIGPSLAFSRDLLTIEKELGRGAFGRVLLGTALGIEEVGKTTKVAVKTLKGSADRQAKTDLLEEIELMRTIGPHPNIVKLLGYCIEEEPIYLIVEFMGKGDLKKVLKSYRDRDLGTGYANVSGYSQSLSRTLVRFARDVARGMAFLSSQQCIHRDLAARNVLVTEDLKCKVSDFGLSRDVMNVRVYQRQSQGLLPIRWMALESLQYDEYTTDSDVWSYGVLLWEIVTLGARPYPDVPSAKTLSTQLKMGYRMTRPTNCKKPLYSIMLRCWNADPSSRPNFQDICKKLDDMLSEEMTYITVNNVDETIYEVPTLELADERV